MQKQQHRLRLSLLDVRSLGHSLPKLSLLACFALEKKHTLPSLGFTFAAFLGEIDSAKLSNRHSKRL